MNIFKKLSSWAAISVLILFCIGSFSLMLYASRTDSAIDDELAHIPAGYGYVHNLDYRLNPEHPPLIKALAMAPVLLLNPVYPIQTAAWQTEVNGQWDMGYQFLYNAGNDANAIIRTSRVMPILITILLIMLVYFFARRRMGTWWALVPAFMVAFDPTILAHGHYVTTDVGAAFGFLFALYYFLNYIEKPSTKYLWYAGLSFGVAQVTKFSTPLLVILFAFLMAVLWIKDLATQWSQTEQTRRVKIFAKKFGTYAWRLIAIFAIGYIVVVYPIYFLFTAHYPTSRQLSDTQQILGSFGGGPTPAGHMCNPARCLASADIWMAGHRITQPIAQYMLGVLMVLQRADGGNTIYFLGEIRGSGGWIYFPVLFLIKESIPTLIIVLFALCLALFWTLRNHNRTAWRARVLSYLRLHFAEFSMASFIVLYWGYSMHSPLNIGIRHIIPTIPFIFILAAMVWKKWITNLNVNTNDMSLPGMIHSVVALSESFKRAIIKYAVLILLLFWILIETLFAAPYFLSYFNEFAGGTWNGYHYVTDSNYDWGQDLLRLQSFVNEHPEIDTIAVDYFGGGNAKYYLGNKEVDWSSSKGNPADQGIHWIAISVNTLEGALQPLAPGQSRNASDTYSWLTALRPVAPGMGNVPTPDYRAGTSIFIYHIQ